jgi:hypothetical protein
LPTLGYFAFGAPAPWALTASSPRLPSARHPRAGVDVARRPGGPPPTPPSPTKRRAGRHPVEQPAGLGGDLFCLYCEAAPADACTSPHTARAARARRASLEEVRRGAGCPDLPVIGPATVKRAGPCARAVGAMLAPSASARGALGRSCCGPAHATTPSRGSSHHLDPRSQGIRRFRARQSRTRSGHRVLPAGPPSAPAPGASCS